MGSDPHKIDVNKAIFLNFDGLCEPRNPGGVATYGVVAKRDGRLLFSENGLADAEPWTDAASNNVAEYSAIVRGLKWLKENGYIASCVVVRGDSKLVIKQLSGEFKVKSYRIVELYHEAAELMSEFKDIHLEWVDRSFNSEADLQSRIGYAKYLKSHPSRRG